MVWGFELAFKGERLWVQKHGNPKKELWQVETWPKTFGPIPGGLNMTHTQMGEPPHPPASTKNPTLDWTVSSQKSATTLDVNAL